MNLRKKAITHKFRLRENFEMVFKLPGDFDRLDLQRLTEHLQTHVMAPMPVKKIVDEATFTGVPPSVP
jgi:hypothetical protein